MSAYREPAERIPEPKEPWKMNRQHTMPSLTALTFVGPISVCVELTVRNWGELDAFWWSMLGAILLLIGVWLTWVIYLEMGDQLRKELRNKEK